MSSRLYSAVLVEEEGTASTLQALLEVFTEQPAIEPLDNSQFLGS